MLPAAHPLSLDIALRSGLLGFWTWTTLLVYNKILALRKYIAHRTGHLLDLASRFHCQRSWTPRPARVLYWTYPTQLNRTRHNPRWTLLLRFHASPGLITPWTLAFMDLLFSFLWTLHAAHHLLPPRWLLLVLHATSLGSPRTAFAVSRFINPFSHRAWFIILDSPVFVIF